MGDVVAAQMVAKLDEHGPFMDYVFSVLSSEVMAYFVVMFCFGLVGVMSNWFWKWITDQITGGLWKYLFTDYPKRTIASFAVIFVWAGWAVDPLLTWTQAINLALTTGFAIDVLVNKYTPAKTDPSKPPVT